MKFRTGFAERSADSFIMDMQVSTSFPLKKKHTREKVPKHACAHTNVFWYVGAINESIADTMGTLFERWLHLKHPNLRGAANVTIGEVNAKAWNIVRNMRNPKQSPLPQPDTYRGDLWKDPNNAQLDFGGFFVFFRCSHLCVCFWFEIGDVFFSRCAWKQWSSKQTVDIVVGFARVRAGTAASHWCVENVETTFQLHRLS